MHHADYPQALASIERTLSHLSRQLQHQEIALAQLRDELAAARRGTDWYHVQFSQMLRLLCHRSSEVRATLLYSLVNEHPLSPEVLDALLELTRTATDELELELGQQP